MSTSGVPSLYVQDEAVKQLREKRLAQYAEKKGKSE